MSGAFTVKRVDGLAVAIRCDDTDGREPRCAHRTVEIHAFRVEHARERAAELVREQSGTVCRTAHIEPRAARDGFGREPGALLAEYEQIDERFAADEDHVVSPPAELSTVMRHSP
jgi:hypothetical protein